ncbi:MAG: SDR family oxidoreductase [Candidatus Methylopumilus sp.]|jgi:nucleoside-diphosphate-sugar epimerase
MAIKVLIAGCGDVGSYLGQLLVAKDYAVTGLRRIEAPLPDGMQALRADVTQPDSLKSLASLAPEILVYCVAAGAHTDESYRAQYVDGLRNVLAALSDAASLRHVIFTSSTGVYGQQGDALLDETTIPMPSDFSGERMLQAEALLAPLACKATVMRLSGIYGPGRNRMINLARDVQRWPQSNAWTNRIHRDDAANAIAHIIARVSKGLPVDDSYIVTDSNAVSQYEVLQWIAGQMGVAPQSVEVPAVNGGKRLSNQRLLATGFELKYPDYIRGYSSLLSPVI